MRSFYLFTITTFIFLSCTSSNKISFVDELKEKFRSPTDENTLWTYWYWLRDDISKEGITKDLEAMKKVGIGTAFIGNINPEEKDGKIPMLSEQWWDHMVHAIEEGKRIGVDIGVFNCPGWSQSGGPWVTYDKSMRHLVYSEVKVEGGRKLNIKLEKPKDIFQDTHAIAFKSIIEENNTINLKNAKIKVHPNMADYHKLFDLDSTTVSSFSGSIDEFTFDFQLKKPETVRNLTLNVSNKVINQRCDIYAKLDGEFSLIKSYEIERVNLMVNVGPNVFAPVSISIPETDSKDFRIVFTNKNNNIFDEFEAKPRDDWKLSEIILSAAPRLEDYSEKNLGKMHPTPFPKWKDYLWDQQPESGGDGLKIKPSNVIDISKMLDSEGRISWDVPQGNWTILRFGMTPTGTKNAPSAPQGKGYEIDKASSKLARYHFEQYVGKLLDKIPEGSKKAFKYIIADSYEMGSQNWSDNYTEKFLEKFNYNPVKYLPVFSGRIVGSVDESERFLWDLRRLTADLIAYEYVGGLKKIGNENNLKLWLENYGHWGFPSEFLLYGGQSDLISGEFWNEGSLGDIECKSASSAAHIYGKKRVSAEAFTAAGRAYVRHPALLKKRGDWSFTEGINHFVLHLYIHQPDDKRIPGVNAWFSTEFNRHNTWFYQSKSYFDYLRRCQYMLQLGEYSADVCYFIGENAPIMTGSRNPELPKGYSYDYINADIILNKLDVLDGKFILPNGISYDMMILPKLESMTPETLSKIETLVSDGGKIYGEAPKYSPSLKNYPNSDSLIKKISKSMWSGDNNITTYGKGKIINKIPISEALDKLEIKQDVDLGGDYPVLWTHRTDENMDIYFLTNQSDKKIVYQPSFRIKDKHPQLWDPITGDTRPLNSYEQKKGRIYIDIEMLPFQSWFIVFSDKKSSVNDPNIKNFPDYKLLQKIDSPWEVEFENKSFGPKEKEVFNQLSDWTLNEDEKIKFYSGSATYKNKFTIDLESKNYNNIFLDLGDVGVMASLKINGTDVGTTWIAPHHFDISSAIKTGENRIEIEVVNVWRNRLTGDSFLKKEKRFTSVSVDRDNSDLGLILSKKDSLISSGLIGPVSIKAY